VRTVFLGPKAFRAGWRVLVFAALLIAVQAVLQWPVIALAKRWGVSRGTLDPLAFTLADSVTLVAVLAATAVMSRAEGRQLSDYGLPGKNAFGRKFWEGAAFGFAAATILILLMWFSGGYSFGSLALHGPALVYFAAMWILAALLIGFLEECFFRGYPQFTLSTGIGFWPAALLISFLFGALHFFSKPHERWTDWAGTSLLGLLMCLTLRRTGDLRFAIGLHAAFDFGAIFVYSGPNGGQLARGHLLNATFHGPTWLTGGPQGPEASLLVFPVIALMFFSFDRLYREACFRPQ
jgi:membrane protease YdiL (CAAX protease family)